MISDQTKELVYTHRVHYTFTAANEPERRGIKAFQKFTREDWARDFMNYAKESVHYENVYIRKIGVSEEETNDQL